MSCCVLGVLCSHTYPSFPTGTNFLRFHYIYYVCIYTYIILQPHKFCIAKFLVKGRCVPWACCTY